MNRFKECVQRVSETVQEYYPEWTQLQSTDPGVTFVEVFAFLGDNLLIQNYPVTDAARVSLARIVAKFGRGGKECDHQELESMKFFNGRILTSEDLSREQEANRERRIPCDKVLGGYGTLSGLEVQIDHTEPTEVRVTPGIALSPSGRLIVVPCPKACVFPSEAKVAILSIGFSERQKAPVSVEVGICDTRIQDSYTLVLDTAIAEDSIPLAKFINTKGRWRRDRKFRPPRVFPHAGHHHKN